jgi:lipopolysaccharide/colanic/teichoic acid biosynthesis glycosyltransferase
MSFVLRENAIEPETFDAGLSEPAARPEANAYLCRKVAVGRGVALVLLLAGSPIILLTMLVVRLTSRGPAIFRQTRVGLNGRIFTMYKVRTMRVDAEAATGPVWSQNNDPRVTRVGRVIRKLHLDEFPQLINVIKGEMGLIGPRPERPEFTQRLALALPGYLDRLVVRPGITGLAQINLPPDTDLNSVRRKLVLDLRYVREACLSLDLRILACTFLRLFGIKGPKVTRLMGLERSALLCAPLRTAKFQTVTDGGLDLENMSRESASVIDPILGSRRRREGRQDSFDGDVSCVADGDSSSLDDEDDLLLDGPRLPR